MPIHVEEMRSDVTVAEGELPLSPAQIDKLVALVAQCLAARAHDARQIDEATQLGRHAAPPSRVDE